jgi:hypothetical protein
MSSEQPPPAHNAEIDGKISSQASSHLHWVYVTKDDGVQKQILTVGEGELPPLHAVCIGAAAFVSVVTEGNATCLAACHCRLVIYACKYSCAGIPRFRFAHASAMDKISCNGCSDHKYKRFE